MHSAQPVRPVFSDCAVRQRQLGLDMPSHVLSELSRDSTRSLGAQSSECYFVAQVVHPDGFSISALPIEGPPVAPVPVPVPVVIPTLVATPVQPLVSVRIVIVNTYHTVTAHHVACSKLKRMLMMISNTANFMLNTLNCRQCH